MLVVPGAEITQSRLAGRKNSHIIALDIQRYISADQSADEIAANRDDLFSVTSLKHYPYVANSDFHKPKHLYSWKTLVRSEKNWPAVRRALRDNVDIALTLFRNGSRGRAF